MEEALIDGYMELTTELIYDMRSVFFENNEQKKVSLLCLFFVVVLLF